MLWAHPLVSCGRMCPGSTQLRHQTSRHFVQLRGPAARQTLLLLCVSGVLVGQVKAAGAVVIGWPEGGRPLVVELSANTARTRLRFLSTLGVENGAAAVAPANAQHAGQVKLFCLYLVLYNIKLFDPHKWEWQHSRAQCFYSYIFTDGQKKCTRLFSLIQSLLISCSIFESLTKSTVSSSAPLSTADAAVIS